MKTGNCIEDTNLVILLMPHWGESLPHGPHWGIWVAEKFLNFCGKSFTWIWHLTANHKSLRNHNSFCLVFTELLVWEKEILLPPKAQQELHIWASDWAAGEFGTQGQAGRCFSLLPQHLLTFRICWTQHFGHHPACLKPCTGPRSSSSTLASVFCKNLLVNHL